MLAPLGRGCWEDRKLSSIYKTDLVIPSNDFFYLKIIGTTNCHDSKGRSIGTSMYEQPSNFSPRCEGGIEPPLIAQLQFPQILVNFVPVHTLGAVVYLYCFV